MNPVVTAASKLTQMLHFSSRTVPCIILPRFTCHSISCRSFFNSSVEYFTLNKCYNVDSLSHVMLTASRLTCHCHFRQFNTTTSVPSKANDSQNHLSEGKKKNGPSEKGKSSKEDAASSSSSSDSDSESDSDDDEKGGEKKSKSPPINPKSSVLFTGGKKDDEVDEILYFLREPPKTRYGPVKVAITILAGLTTGAAVAKVGSHLLAKYDIYVFEDDDKEKDEEKD